MVRKQIRGSFTVEAAFILPFILFCILAFLYLALNLHDKVALAAIIDSCGLQIQDELRIYEKTTLERRLVRQIKEQAENKLCITTLERITVKTGILAIHVEYDVYRRLSLPGITALLGSSRQSAEEDILIYDPMKAVRSLGGRLNDESGI